MIGVEDFGSKRQCDLSNGLVTMITDLSFLLSEREGANEDLSMYASIVDLGILIGPIAEAAQWQTGLAIDLSLFC